MIRRPPRSTQGRSSAASDVYKRQGRDIEIEAGVKGRSKTFISAGRDAKVKFIENAELEAKRDIQISNAAVNSTVRSKRNVIVVGDPGSIIGGSVSAGHAVEANEIGSDMNLKTSVEVGIDPDMRQRAALLRSQIALNMDNLNKPVSYTHLTLPTIHPV